MTDYPSLHAHIERITGAFPDVFVSFDNMPADLMHLLRYFPSILLREGYVLDAVEVGRTWSSGYIRPYCHRAGASEEYLTKRDAEDNRRSHRGSTRWRPYSESMMVPGPVGYLEHDELPAWISCFSVPFEPEAVFEAWLMSCLPDFCMVRQHTLYARRRFLLRRSQLPDFQKKVDMVLKEINDYGAPLPVPDKPISEMSDEEIRAYYHNVDAPGDYPARFDYRLGDCLPKVELHGDEGFVECCYWNSWQGLMRWRERVRRVGDGVAFSDPELDTLLRYRCGIWL